MRVFIIYFTGFIILFGLTELSFGAAGSSKLCADTNIGSAKRTKPEDSSESLKKRIRERILNIEEWKKVVSHRSSSLRGNLYLSYVIRQVRVVMQAYPKANSEEVLSYLKSLEVKEDEVREALDLIDQGKVSILSSVSEDMGVRVLREKTREEEESERVQGEKSVEGLKGDKARLQDRVGEILTELEIEGGYVRGVEFSNRLVKEGIDRKLGMDVALKNLGLESVRIVEEGGHSIVVLREKKKEGGGKTKVMISPKRLELQILVDKITEIVEEHYSKGESLAIPAVAEKAAADFGEVADRRFIVRIRNLINNRENLKNKVKIQEYERFSAKEFRELEEKVAELVEGSYSRGELLTKLEVARHVAAGLGVVADQKFIVRICNLINNRENLKNKVKIQEYERMSAEEFQDLVEKVAELVEGSYNRGELLTKPEVARRVAAGLGVVADQKFTERIHSLINNREDLKNKVKIKGQEFLSAEKFQDLVERVVAVIEESYSRGELLTKPEVARRVAAGLGVVADQKFTERIHSLINNREDLKNKIKIQERERMSAEEFQDLVEKVAELVEGSYNRGELLTKPEVARRVATGLGVVADRRFIERIRNLIDNREDLKNKVKIKGQEFLSAEKFQDLVEKVAELVEGSYSRGELLTIPAVAKKVAADFSVIVDQKFIERIRNLINRREDLKDKVKVQEKEFLSVEKFQDLVEKVAELVEGSYNRGEPLTIPEVEDKIVADPGMVADGKFIKRIRRIIDSREDLKNKVKVKK